MSEKPISVLRKEFSIISHQPLSGTSASMRVARHFFAVLTVESQGAHCSTQSIFKSRKAEVQGEVPGEPDYLVTEAEISDSYMSVELLTIQWLDEHCSLLILNLTWHPAHPRRFESIGGSGPPPTSTPSSSPDS